MEAEPLAHRHFSLDDQLDFARLTGDANPMHVDAVFARRTQAGAPAVHGMHLLLWALDTLARSRKDLPAVRALRARFSNFVLVGDRAELTLQEWSMKRAKLAVSAGGVTAAQLFVEFGSPGAAATSDPPAPACDAPTSARDITFEEMQTAAGTLAFVTPADEVAKHFPAAAEWIGPARLTAIGASSTVVGMICPGLHSIYASLAVELVEGAGAGKQLGFRVGSSDPRFRLLRLAIAGSGITGTIECLARIPPVAQETMQFLRGVVAPDQFANSTALVVGGSRGLGELVAKLIASGGGKVIITYRAGRSDADKVAQEIRAAGGDCTCLEYDVRKPAAVQLGGLTAAPTHLYYFATPVIYRQQAAAFSPQRFREFIEFYVDGFWNLLQVLHEHRRELQVFYPSTVFVAETPRGMTEYAMAKAAGELLCARLNESLAPTRILVNRLPRMATDQTASNLPVETQPALETLLPLVRELQSLPV